MSKAVTEFTPLNIAVLTLSDSRDERSDKSGAYLAECLQQAGHRLADKQITKDDIYQMRAVVCAWVAEPSIEVVLLTGGTGFNKRDATPEGIKPLFDTEVEGFGELFRQISWQEIGSSTLQSRALAGISNGTLIVCLPGSTNACRTGWEKILKDQLDSRFKPCNFVNMLQQHPARQNEK